MAELPSVVMIFTGGTISMRIVPGRGALPASGGREILESVPKLATIANVTCEDFDRLPGPHWTPERMLDLARLIDRRLATGEFIGAVVTHGTDTIEETAYLLDLVLTTDKPVVLTGAMKTSDDPQWDGPKNLTAAVREVCTAPTGVWVVMAGRTHAARAVVKAHTDAFTAFISSPPTGTRERIPVETIEPRVDLIAAAAGADGKFVSHAVATGAKAIVLEALGCGNVPPKMLEAVRDAVLAGIPVVVASRCREGKTSATYGYEGGGVTLRDAGAIFAGDLAASKARIKLMVLLGAGRDPAAVRRAFEA